MKNTSDYLTSDQAHHAQTISANLSGNVSLETESFFLY